MNQHWFPNQTPAIPQSVWTANQVLLQESWIQNYENTGIQKMKGDNEETLAKDLQDPWSKVDAHSAFLGPSLWDESDFMVDYSALDEFLNESGISPKRNQTNEIPQTTGAKLSSPTGSTESSTGILTDTFLAKPAESTRCYTKSESGTSASGAAESSNGIEDFPMFFSSSDLALALQPGQSFDPRTTTFSANQLRPHPVIKKSKKKAIPDDTKDERYWERRQKNNLAAKRSRDARRLKENQIIMRASFLEKENALLRAELEKVNCENASLTLRLKRYEKI